MEWSEGILLGEARQLTILREERGCYLTVVGEVAQPDSCSSSSAAKALSSCFRFVLSSSSGPMGTVANKCALSYILLILFLLDWQDGFKVLILVARLLSLNNYINRV